MPPLGLLGIVVATALGARPADVPMTWRHASDQLSQMYGSRTLRVGAQARALSVAVLAPRLARAVPPLASWNRLVTIGLLPTEIRREYGLSWTDADERRFDRTVQRVRRMRRALPNVIALWPEARG